MVANGQSRFCTKCGVGLAPEARFCTACGAEVLATPPAPMPAAASPAAPSPIAPPVPPVPVAHQPEAASPASQLEQVMAVIPNAVLKSGFLGVKSKAHTIVLTSRRVVFAEVTSAMMKQMVIDARDDAKSEGKGFFGQWGAQINAYSKFAKRYFEMPPDAALAESPNNFAIERSAIEKAKLKCGHTDDTGASSSDRLTIKTTGKKYNIDLGAGLGQAKEALTAAQMI